MQIRIEVDGVVQMDRAFSRVGWHTNDLRPTWPRVERAFQAVEEKMFKSEGAHGGSRWKELTRNYAKWKAAHYGVKLILQRTGALYGAMTGNTGDTVVIKEKDEFGYGTSLFYQPFVQKTRPIVNLNEGDKTYITKEMQKGLVAQMRGDSVITRSLEVTE